jgi:hypothetical protein
MDKTTKYRQLIKSLLAKYVELVLRHPDPKIEPHLIFDEERDEYIWLQTGWSNDRRVHGATLHLRLKNGKIWIEQDWTEDGIASDLLKAGVPNNDIVLAFYDPEIRSMSEFAVN